MSGSSGQILIAEYPGPTSGTANFNRQLANASTTASGCRAITVK